MAIPAEQAGLELAKEITENIERWLADAPDNQKWVMEEPSKDVEVPLADLPAELEDLIGDLIDKEDQLAEDSQDVTSSWMDSLNQGAGWGENNGILNPRRHFPSVRSCPGRTQFQGQFPMMLVAGAHVHHTSPMPGNLNDNVGRGTEAK